MAKGQKKLIKSSVKQSIAQLLKEAEKAHKTGNRKLETRYLQMVMDLVKKHKVRLTKEQKNKFCRKCLVWWVPKETLKLIYDQKHHVIRLKCQCGYTRRL